MPHKMLSLGRGATSRRSAQCNTYRETYLLNFANCYARYTFRISEPKPSSG